VWREESTKLRHPHWFDFRDPGKLWQRTHTRAQAEQERGIERVTEEAIARRSFADVDPIWLEEIVRLHYRVWSFVEYGTFRPWSAAQREALSDTLGQVCVFEGLDRLRHAQDIVVYLMELETHVPGFKDEGGKDRWTSEARYQPTRQLIEKLMYNTWDWGELAVATNLVIDPILTEVAIFALIGRSGPFHGDVVTPFIVSTAERDRRWSLDWTRALVAMVTADEVTKAKENVGFLREWADVWTPLAIAAAEPMAEVYAKVPKPMVGFDQAMSGAIEKQKKLLAELGLNGGAG
jgi:methane monooxygenase component A beta chain/propane monooxygenase small subunit